MSRARFVSALIGLAAVARSISLAWLHPLNWDEIEYFRATDWVRHGLVPYRDFFEHHTPLQWFLFAPITTFVHSPGTAAIIAMRWAQVPIWIAAFWLMSMWMRGAGLALVSRLSAIALALCSSLLMLPAVEYRVDALACALLVLALVLAQRGFTASSGAALVFAGFANVRLGPVLVVALIAFALIRRDRVLRLTAGTAGALAICASYFIVTRSAAIAWQSVIVGNYLADHFVRRMPGIFIHRLAAPFGITSSGFVASAIDPATIVILCVGLIGIIGAFIRRRSEWIALALIQLVNVIFIAMMKFVQNYHFEVVIIVMLPFVAMEIDRWKRDRAVIVAISILVTFSVAVAIFRGKEADLRYQDLIMREADRLTPANGAVFDGAGWALKRKPAYRYWFLREIVRTLEAHGRFQTYRVADAASNPPAAVISDYGARVWLGTHHELRSFFTAHYLPYWRDLWLPAMSAVVPPNGKAAWVVPATAQYRVYAAADLARHPWFGNPIFSGSYARPDADLNLANVRSDANVVLSSDPMQLQRTRVLQLMSHDPRTIGVMIVPVGITELFRQPAGDADLDAATPPQWHVPQLW